jgi:hypothetical protein
MVVIFDLDKSFLSKFIEIKVRVEKYVSVSRQHSKKCSYSLIVTIKQSLSYIQPLKFEYLFELTKIIFYKRSGCDTFAVIKIIK